MTGSNAKHLFEDPETVKKLKEGQSDVIAGLKESHHDEILRLKSEFATKERQAAKIHQESEADHLKIEKDLREQLAAFHIARRP